MMDSYAFWMSTPNLDLLEIAADAGFRRVVLDIEHNGYAPDRREALVVAARALGLAVCVKIEAPEPVWVQRALDLGVNAVILPHVSTLADAKAALAACKYPPLGTRSYAAGRSVSFRAPDADYFARQNREVLCLPMIETAEAFDDVSELLASPLVDGIFVGPFDLALTRGRSTYAFSGTDRADISHLAAAARAAGKPWWMPAWRPEEQRFALDHGASVRIVAAEHQLLQAGLAKVLSDLPDDR
ncbi:aldolase/citrate lyase family protein [uncultured Nitratireductor sp.]|uniref:HpcH/HpaI aldolase family protein n=1 Tax=uncultured Nitratireductor sp. TaxID=520953 RepID=UPI0025F3C59B|nr:aldolase/citrate lyase family protein [uncultured Nitratireductor sp.]